MGYTHYFKTKSDLDKTKWDSEFLPAAKKIVAYAKNVLGIPIVGGGGDEGTLPRFEEECIYLNGLEGDGHETMTIQRPANEFYFCKTALKPYDAVCVALALLADELFDEFSWSSDGDGDDDYDYEGRELKKAALGRKDQGLKMDKFGLLDKIKASLKYRSSVHAPDDDIGNVTIDGTPDDCEMIIEVFPHDDENKKFFVVSIKEFDESGLKARECGRPGETPFTG